MSAGSCAERALRPESDTHLEWDQRGWEGREAPREVQRGEKGSHGRTKRGRQGQTGERQTAHERTCKLRG